jgi:hypothetical protein
MDGLPGMEIGCKTAKEEHIAPIKKMVGPIAARGYYNAQRFSIWHLVLVAILTAVCTACSLPLLSGLAYRIVGTA